MYELRFILLGLGTLTILGVWWWEQRRARATRDYLESRPADRTEPRLGDEEGQTAPLPFDDDDEEPIFATRHPQEARANPGASPPVVTIDDLPDDVDEVELSDHVAPSERPLLHRYDEGPRPAPPSAPVPPAPPKAAVPVSLAPVRPREEPAAAPSDTPAPARPASAREAPRAEPAEPAIQQRIVAIRMVAGAQPVSGRALLAALAAEGLEFGRYSIFHWQRHDGRMLFSVASLLEPGSFDPQQMPAQTFPGISLFAVFPGPVDAAQVFDAMLVAARHLADRLGGSLQDERGQPLSAQRILSLREELVHFQSLCTSIRSRTAG